MLATGLATIVLHVNLNIVQISMERVCAFRECTDKNARPGIKTYPTTSICMGCWDAVSPVVDINHDLLSKCNSNPESRLYASIWIVLLPMLPRCAHDCQHIQGEWDVRNVVRRVPKNSDVVLICFSTIRFFVTDSISDRKIFSANVYHADLV